VLDLAAPLVQDVELWAVEARSWRAVLVKNEE
jgi:hypothetical protein